MKVSTAYPRGVLAHIIDAAIVTLSIRVFAMYGRNKWVLVPLLALVWISIILAVVSRNSVSTLINELRPTDLNASRWEPSSLTAPHRTLQHLD